METSRRKGLAERYFNGLIDALRVLEAGNRRGPGKEPIWQRLAQNGRADTKLVQDALHLLYTRLNGKLAAKKELRSCWPITESSQQKEFKGAMQAWVKALAAFGKLPPQAAQYFVTAYQTWGMRSAELLFHLAVLALEVELERRHPDVLTTVAPALQDAAPGVYELALQEDQHRRQAEEWRLEQLLAAVRRAQQLFAESAAASGEAARHLPPWWSASQAHVDKVQTMQQLVAEASHLAGPVGNAAASTIPLLLRPTAAAAAQSAQGAAGSSSAASSEASPAQILQVLTMRTIPAEEQQQQPSTKLDCSFIQSRVATRHFYMRATLLEAERAMQLPAADQLQRPAVGTPCSVLHLLPPSPPRRNPILDALHSSTFSDAGLPGWGKASFGGSGGATVLEARQGVWAAVCSQESAAQQQEQPLPASAEAGDATESCRPGSSAARRLTPRARTSLPELQLDASEQQQQQQQQQQQGRHGPAAGALATPHERAAGSSHWGSRLHSGHAALPSPPLASMIESADASCLFSPVDSAGSLGAGWSSGGDSRGMGGFSMPPSLTPTPRWGARAEAMRAANDLAHAHQQQQLPEEERQPESPCFAESIASFSVMVGGAGSAAEALLAQQRGAGATAYGSGWLLPVGEEALSPMASASAAVIGGLGVAAPGQSAVGKAAVLGQAACTSPPGCSAAAQQPAWPHGEALGDTGTPESKAPAAQHEADRDDVALGACSSPCSSPATSKSAARIAAGLAGGSSPPAAGQATQQGASHGPGISPPKPLCDSPLGLRGGPIQEQRSCQESRQPLSQGIAVSTAAIRQQLSRFARAGAPATEPAGQPEPGTAGLVCRRAAFVATTGSPTKQKPLQLALTGVRPPADSPAASQASLYSPPKALVSPAGPNSKRDQATLQDVSNASHRETQAGPAKNDLDSVRQRFERLALWQKQ